MNWLRALARFFASSVIFKKGRTLWEKNTADWRLPLSKWDKVLAGSYIILSDFAAGTFPPRFEDQAEAYRNEIEYDVSLPGMDLLEVQKTGRTKPFWNAVSVTKYLKGFDRLFKTLESYGIGFEKRMLELGCGPGWMAEFLATAGYTVVGTTISPRDVELASEKIGALKCKGLNPQLKFVASPMESVDEIPEFLSAFDVVYVFEALHHAYDWRKTLCAAHAALKSGGWLLIANEPNRLHTGISYRVAKLSRTHEIGFRQDELTEQLRHCGFGRVDVLQPRFDNWVTPFWIMARKGS